MEQVSFKNGKYYLKENNKISNKLANGMFKYSFYTIHLQNGLLHRPEQEGTARYNDNRSEYHWNNAPHRWNGPAIEMNTGDKSYYLFGNACCDQNEFEELKLAASYCLNPPNGKWIDNWINPKCFNSKLYNHLDEYYFSPQKGFILDKALVLSTNTLTYEMEITVPLSSRYGNKFYKKDKVPQSIRLQNKKETILLKLLNLPVSLEEIKEFAETMK